MSQMLDFNDPDLAYPPDGAADAPATRAEAEARLAELDDRIAAIRTQIAAADMKRQAGAAALDPDWFHRAKTALRHFQRERAALKARAAALPSRKDRLKDRIIAVVRQDYDAAEWARVLDAAHDADRAEEG